MDKKTLLSEYPEIAAEWDYDKNDSTPENYLPFSNKYVYWKCKLGHSWKVKINDRTKYNTKCPYCANKKVLSGFNDLASNYPKYLKEWDFEKNNKKPEEYLAHSKEKVWWKCKYGHSYQQIISLKTDRDYGCPICSNTKVLLGFNDLASNYPKYLKEWDFEKNNKKPEEYLAHSKEKVWWKCNIGHSYKQSITKRTLRKFGCPYCSGHKALTGFNDLATKYPDLAKEWHPTLNGKYKPENFTFGSGKRTWWICPVGHEYEASIHDRTRDDGNGTNCPICNLQNQTSFPEQLIYFYISKIYPDTLNKYSDIFDNTMELDIYIPSIKYAIEYDGSFWHKNDQQHERELKKYKICKDNNIRLIRVKEKIDDIWNDTCDNLIIIENDKYQYVIDSILNIIGCDKKINVNLNKDSKTILSYLSKINNSLEELRPDICEKWDFEKNGFLKPSMFSVGSNYKVHWKCPDCGHKWISSINSMTREGRNGCAICGNKKRGQTFTKRKVNEVGSLSNNNPELALEWNYEKNSELTPNDVTEGRFKKVWWKCKKCGYEWQQSPNNRKKGIGCPCCSGRVPFPGYNDIETKYPEIIKDWNYDKNIDIKPNQFLPASPKIVWWKCKNCSSEFKDSIRNIIRRGYTCKKCNKNIEGQINFNSL